MTFNHRRLIAPVSTILALGVALPATSGAAYRRNENIKAPVRSTTPKPTTPVGTTPVATTPTK